MKIEEFAKKHGGHPELEQEILEIFEETGLPADNKETIIKALHKAYSFGWSDGVKGIMSAQQNDSNDACRSGVAKRDYDTDK
ncbi:MAG TPA: hypothetical protein VD927_12400 [Chryseosolibacter sp.]|nr:hypothetical protein [Chryseosolibacter sp.]